MIIVYALLVRASLSRASNREGVDCRQDPVHRKRIGDARPTDWISRSLLVVSIVLLTLTSILSHVGQSIGIVFLGLGLSITAFVCYLWYRSHPCAGWNDFWNFLFLVATNLILFVLFGFFVSHDDPAAGVVFLGLFGIVFSYSFWSQVLGNSGLSLIRDILKTFLILLTMLGIAVTLQGLGSLADVDALNSVGQELSKLFGGS